jgi:hypothetical protein
MDTSRDVDKAASERGWRTFWQGIAIDITVALMLAASGPLMDLQWTPVYWTTLGLLLAKTLIQSFVANVMRRLVSPKTESV